MTVAGTTTTSSISKYRERRTTRRNISAGPAHHLYRPLTVMADAPGSPSTTSLKRKRPASDQPSFVESALSPGSKQLVMDKSSADIAMATIPAELDLDGFKLQSLSLLETATASEFLEHLSSAVDQVVAPGSLVAPELFVSALGDILPFNTSLPAQVLDVFNQCWIDQTSDVRASLSAMLHSLISTNIVATDLAIELVDRNILQDSAIISNSQILATRSVRINTGLLYKQQKFNLLREENEGYAKLSHEFNVALSELPKGGFIDAADISAKSNELLTVVNALIGYFELDPNRVLDNILDICSQNLLSHARFILYFLHRSPWAPVTLAVNQPFSSVVQTEKRQRLDSIQRDFSGYFKSEMGRKGGSKLAAQLLGFKLRYFASAVDRNERSYTAPESLIFLIALLIKSGFIKLGDIYPYLNPLDNTIGDEYRKWKEEMDEKAFMAKSNPLALAGALGDDEGGDGQASQATETESKVAESQKTAETNQKVSLLNALLAVGNLPAALQLLSLHPQISGPHVSVSDGIHRLLHISIATVYAPFSPSRFLEPRIIGGLESQRKRAAASRTNPGTVDWLEDLERKSVRGYSPFPNQEYGDRRIRFFLEDELWADDIPVCENMDDFYAFAVNMLRFTGPRVGNDVSLLVKLARIGKGQFVNGEQSQLLMRRWVEIARISLIPAISLIGANPGVVNEIYDLIRFFSFETRFSLYGEWQTVAYKTYPELKMKASETDKDTKGILRRISKQDVKRFGRALAKKSTSNPLILWAIAINQIENYDNFVEVVVDAAKFCTNLGYDVLEFVILTSLANPFKNRVKEDGTSIAVWLTGLSAFCAKVFRRYTHMDVSTATTYVACQLKSSNIYDLIVLRDLITQMAGILVRENLSDHQLRCYAGGEALKEQAMTLLRESGVLAGWKKSGARLLKALLDTNLAGLLLILIAQERGACLFNSKMEHTSNLKLLGNLFDECHGVLVQFHEFIVSNLDSVSFERLLPPFEKIVTDYGVDPSAAFYLWRPILAEKIKQHDIDLSLELQKQKIRKGLANSEKSNDSRNETADPSPPTDNEMQGVSQDTSASTLAVSAGLEETVGVEVAAVKSDEPWHPALRSFIDETRLVLAKDVWSYLTPEFYTTFWQLSLYDIWVPMQAYSQEVQKLTNEIKKKEVDKTDISPLAIQRRRRERERLQASIDQLNQEFKIQTTAYQTTKMRLSKEKDFWFDWAKLPSGRDTVPPRNKTVLAILQHCIIPRCLFGPNEANFCARFLREMHRLGTKNFSSLTLMDKIFVSVSETVIFTCTNREAENYGRFLRELLIELSRWYTDKAAYEKEAIGPSIPGFLKKWSVNASEAIHLQYEEYRTVMSKWHKNLTTAFKNCLESRDYMHVRNALAVLEKIIGQYPQVDFHGNSLEEKVSAIAAKGETRGDLQVRAQGYLALLRKSSKSWVSSAKFASQSKPSTSADSPNPNRPTTPQATLSPARAMSSTTSDREILRAKSNLNPAAPSFRPQDEEHRKTEKSINGSAIPSKSTSGEPGRFSADKPTLRGSRSPRTPNQTPKTELLSPKEPNDRLSRTSRTHDYDQGKPDNARQERSSRQHEDSAASTDRLSNNGPAGFSDKSNPKLLPSSGGRDESQNSVGGSDQHRGARIPSAASAQGDDTSASRPRTPEGPRVNIDAAPSNSPGQRAQTQRDPQALRQSRYDTIRGANPSSNPRTIQGFRAPPPTGPRSAAISSGMPTLANVNISRQQHPGRTVGAEPPRAVGNFAARPSLPATGKSESNASSNPPLPPGNVSDRNLSRPISHRDNQSDLSNPASTSESRRSRTTQSDTNSKSDQVQTSDAPRGPTDWRGRQKRDPQDEDPRRLSRGPESSVEESETAARQLRPTDDNTRSATSKHAESTKEPVSSASRGSRDKDEKDSNQLSRQSRESRAENEKAEISDGRRARTTARTETNDRETTGRSRGIPSVTGQSERAKVSSTHESKSAESGNTREGKEASREQKENMPAERKEPHKEKPEPTSREPKDAASKEQRSTRSHREDDGGRRREEKDVSTRNQREDTRDRTDRTRGSHHGRVSSRRSPSRTHSDRGEKKERDRDSERRNGSHRDTRETEHRDKERSSRESEHRRDVRERDRSSRDKEPENRRGSRKHERDRSADAVDRGTRSGDGVDSSGTGESANKRRRVVR